MCPQDRTERILLTHLERLSGSVLRPSELGGLEEAADHVDVQLEGERGAQSVRARWLVGGDGMHSRVRVTVGVAFRGAAYEESFVLADVHMDWPLSREEVSLFLSPEGLVVVAPLPEQRYRIVAIFDDAPEAPSAAFMQDLLNRRGPTWNAGRIHDVAWSSRFRIHHRVAENPRKGQICQSATLRMFHSPAHGPGVNTGIQDGISLAQVLADTLRDGNEERVDAWAEERHKVATEVVALTHRLTRLATMKSGPRTSPAQRCACVRRPPSAGDRSARQEPCRAAGSIAPRLTCRAIPSDPPACPAAARDRDRARARGAA